MLYLVRFYPCPTPSSLKCPPERYKQVAQNYINYSDTTKVKRECERMNDKTNKMRQTRIPNRQWRDMVEGNENHCARDPVLHSFFLSPILYVICTNKLLIITGLSFMKNCCRKLPFSFKENTQKLLGECFLVWVEKGRNWTHFFVLHSNLKPPTTAASEYIQMYKG